MIDIERFDGKVEFEQLLKKLVPMPTNTEIVEKTGIPKSSVSEYMKGKRYPSKKDIDKFKKGFGIKDDQTETKKPPSGDSGLKDKLIQLLESSLKRVEDELERVLAENERLKNK